MAYKAAPTPLTYGTFANGIALHPRAHTFVSTINGANLRHVSSLRWTRAGAMLSNGRLTCLRRRCPSRLAEPRQRSGHQTVTAVTRRAHPRSPDVPAFGARSSSSVRGGSVSVLPKGVLATEYVHQRSVPLTEPQYAEGTRGAGVTFMGLGPVRARSSRPSSCATRDLSRGSTTRACARSSTGGWWHRVDIAIRALPRCARALHRESEGALRGQQPSHRLNWINDATNDTYPQRTRFWSRRPRAHQAIDCVAEKVARPIASTLRPVGCARQSLTVAG